MIPAKISNLNPPQVTGYRLPEPEKFDITEMYCEEHIEKWKRSVISYEESKFIADVENTVNIGDYVFFWYERIHLNQSCFIELTGEGKAKIVKL